MDRHSVALVVMVTQKLPLEALSAEAAHPMPKLTGFPVDVQETGSFFSPG